MFDEIVEKIFEVSDMEFEKAVAILENAVNADLNFIEMLQQIETIPEKIPHDSTEEKLFSKVSDAVLARALREIGLKATVLKERGDSADVLAESPIYGYTLVADAKAFRMSRTAKNQKDFKVTALSGWRNESEYAVLCAPYFQYPSKTSQIYAQSITHNVCLFSWEHLLFMIQNGVKESLEISLAPIWGFGKEYAKYVLCSNMKACFFEQMNQFILSLLKVEKGTLCHTLYAQKRAIAQRGEKEKEFWKEETNKIRNYSREEAIEELLRTKKIYKNMQQIDAYITSLKGLHV